MAVQVILMENVTGLGSIGDEVRVADGYARNFLVPREKAVYASTAQHAGLMRQLELKRQKYQVQLDKEIAEASAIAATVNEQSLTIAAQAQEDGKLYGSVGAQQIVNALLEVGIEIDRNKVALKEPIREVGTTAVDIHLHPEVSATVTVTVVALEG